MKKTPLFLLLTSLLIGSAAMAQFNLPPKKAAADTGRNKTTNPATTAPPTITNKVTGLPPAGTGNANAANAQPTKTIDTTMVGGFMGEPLPRSLRSGTAVERTITREKKPLPYEHLREDDWHYSEMIWSEIDAREKMNQAFMYPGKDDNGVDQRFFSILLSAIKNDSVVAFSAEGGDDQFRTPLAYADISKMLKGSLDTQLVPNPNNPNIFDTAVIYDTKFAPNPDSIYTFRLKQQWIFDKEASRMFCRTIGIAPVAKIVLNGKSVSKTLFWVYYPDIRQTLTKFLVYNPKSFASRMTWEDLFENRYYSSYIIKTSNNNPNDKFLSGMIKDPLFRLLEGDNIKERLFNYEQDLWQY
ncbi:type IX secretion system protein PorN/GldN [Sediminibacterium ginsengisoli]|uniref:Gliding motility associated protien GldN n=1 Tax=Sediminibacterium ginsengisoli TaxID=413434 RepID=A0A1T4JVT9_9BACT|nr:gliding motility protein GldN [Sediminibacterium ginsengisoli]SJZ34273.1 gliding motility associated protien GldN [Sediminibacterium ginsengisoli]